jgi:hypothetical protein
VIEFAKATREDIVKIVQEVEAEMREANLGYHYPLLFGDDTKRYGHCVRQG